MEIWKSVKDYKNLYQVSNLGRFKSLARKIGEGYKGVNHKLAVPAMIWCTSCKMALDYIDNKEYKERELFKMR